MTGDEIHVVKTSLNDLTQALLSHQTMTAHLNTLVAGQAGMNATLGALESLTKVQIEKLFSKHDAHEARLTQVEKTYVERATCQRVHDKAQEADDEQRALNQRDHDAFRVDLNRLSLRMAWVGGAIAFGTAAVNWMVSNWHVLQAAGAAAGVQP